ncbi:MAG: hypothetical protein ABI678_08190 [Kofleriaceae bacterium]
MTLDRELGLVATLARAGDRAGIPTLRAASVHADPRIRVLAQLGLARAGDDLAAPVDARLADEPELICYYVLAARAGGLAIGESALDHLAAQAGYAGTPAALRAGCTWAVASHDEPRARRILELLEPAARSHLGAIARARRRVRGAPDRHRRSARAAAHDRWRAA